MRLAGLAEMQDRLYGCCPVNALGRWKASAPTFRYDVNIFFVRLFEIEQCNELFVLFVIYLDVDRILIAATSEDQCVSVLSLK
ncbi:MAG: hypothetical protein FWD68_14320 [Alphaproteobacteria bacterium]|nr:hypothetical protein [Alphaproteobacteria bacterium]